MLITGACHCGRITFTASVDPAAVSICHCTDCQTFSGSPWRASVACAAADFALKGEPKVYVKVADSGSRRAQGFCPDCGSPIFATAADNPQMYNIRLGVIRERRELGAPAVQIWRESALPWSLDISAIPAPPRG